MKHSPFLQERRSLWVLELSGCGVKKNTKAAEAEVERFHRLWNADEFKSVYDDAHMNFQNSQTADQTVATLKRMTMITWAFKQTPEGRCD